MRGIIFHTVLLNKRIQAAAASGSLGKGNRERANHSVPGAAGEALRASQANKKKERESPKPGKSGKSSKEGQDIIDSEIPSRKNSLIAARSAVSSKRKVPAPQPIVKKDKGQNSSRFSASNNRELQKLSSLKEVTSFAQHSCFVVCVR